MKEVSLYEVLGVIVALEKIIDNKKVLTTFLKHACLKDFGAILTSLEKTAEYFRKETVEHFTAKDQKD